MSVATAIQDSVVALGVTDAGARPFTYNSRNVSGAISSGEVVQITTNLEDDQEESFSNPALVPEQPQLCPEELDALGLKYLSDKFQQPKPANAAEWDGSKDLSMCIYHADAISMKDESEFDSVQGDGVPVVRLFGTTPEGVNSTVLVRGFLPYIYVQPAESFISRMKLPKEFENCKLTAAQIDGDEMLAASIASYAPNVELCHAFRLELFRRLHTDLIDRGRKSPYSGTKYFRDDTTRYVSQKRDIVKDVELVRRRTVHGRYKYLTWMLKVTFGNPAFIVPARDILTKSPFKWSTI